MRHFLPPLKPVYIKKHRHTPYRLWPFSDTTSHISCIPALPNYNRVPLLFTLPRGSSQRHAIQNNLNKDLAFQHVGEEKQRTTFKIACATAAQNEIVIDEVCTSTIISSIFKSPRSAQGKRPLRQAFVSLLKLITPYLLLRI